MDIPTSERASRGGKPAFILSLISAIIFYALGSIFTESVAEFTDSLPQYDFTSLGALIGGFLASYYGTAKLQLLMYAASFTIYSLPAGIAVLSYRALKLGSATAAILGHTTYLFYLLYTLTGILSLYLTLCVVCRCYSYSISSRYFARTVSELFLSRTARRFTADFLLLTGLTTAFDFIGAAAVTVAF